MKVHFITSRPTLENDIDTLRRIIMTINDAGHTLALDWVERAYKRNHQSQNSAADWTAIVRQNLETIAKSDVIIAETTHENFAIGYQIAVAVQQKKPVLLLRHESADKAVFVSGLEDGWIKHADYNKDNVQQIVDKFLNENDIQSKDMRFNFFIDRQIYNYLRWAAFKTGKTKAEILRDLVENEIEKQDFRL
jgi:hypothetical protein